MEGAVRSGLMAAASVDNKKWDNQSTWPDWPKPPQEMRMGGLLMGEKFVWGNHRLEPIHLAGWDCIKVCKRPKFSVLRLQTHIMKTSSLQTNLRHQISS